MVIGSYMHHVVVLHGYRGVYVVIGGYRWL